MTEFTCIKCGRCCTGMGRYVSVERRLPGHRVVGRHALGKEVFYATVQREYRDRFAARDTVAEEEGWCPFLAHSGEDKRIVCIIHPDRPRFCRSFRCCVLRIMDREGEYVGSVKGRRDLVTSDPDLHAVWERVIVPKNGQNELEWREMARKELDREGYDVIVYD
jgi:Fe-S-cluster containining protein